MIDHLEDNYESTHFETNKNIVADIRIFFTGLVFIQPIGKANVIRQGHDLTIVALSRMVHEAMKAADELAKTGLDVEVVDVRSIQPFDTETIISSVGKTHRALVVHEAVRFGGFGAEIAAQIQEYAFDDLDAPVARVGAPFSPVPFSPALEKVWVPNSGSIVSAVNTMLGQ